MAFFPRCLAAATAALLLSVPPIHAQTTRGDGGRSTPSDRTSSPLTPIPVVEGALPVVYLGVPDTYVGTLNRAMKASGLTVTLVKDIPERPDLSPFQIILLDVGTSRHMLRLRPLLATARQRGALIIGLSPSLDALEDVVTERLADHPDIGGYRAQPTPENMARFLGYVSVRFLLQEGEVQPPVTAPESGVYHPSAPALFPSVEAYRMWRPAEPCRPTVGILVPSSNIFGQNTDTLDALVRRLEADANVVAWYGDDLPPFQPDAWVTVRPFGTYLSAMPALDAPVIQTMRLMTGTPEQWARGEAVLSGSAQSMWVVGPEARGAIEPTLTGYSQRSPDDTLLLPLPERIDRVARRVAGWTRLRSKPNAEKRIAMVHYNRGAAYLNVPHSIDRLARALRDHGYDVALPDDVDTLSRRLQADSWGDGSPEDLQRLAANPETIRIPVADYARWFEDLSRETRDEVVRMWGPPPGTSLVYQDAFLAPCVKLGNLWLLRLPPRADASSEDAVYHSNAIPPTHAYLAFYLWLCREMNADAVIHLGTHGTLEFLPHRADALGPLDYPDLLIQDLPNIYPYNVYNAVEAVTARRRGSAVVISHNIPALRVAQMPPELKKLSDLLAGYGSVEDPVLKQEYTRQIERLVKETPDVAATVKGFHLPPDSTRFERMVDGLREWLEDIQNQQTPDGLHTLGVQPEGEALAQSVFSLVREDLTARLAEIAVGGTPEPVPPAESTPGRQAFGPEPTASKMKTEPLVDVALDLVRSVVLDHATPQDVQARLLGAPDEQVGSLLQRVADWATHLSQSDEIGSILTALDGKFVPSGPGGDPTQNPGVLPLGRNVHSMDPSTIPTAPAWEVGKRLTVEFLDGYRRETGAYPTKVGFSLFGGETIRHQGVLESQVLYLLGVEPVWSSDGRVNELRLLPAAALGRPRIDVVLTATGQYRDVFGDVMRLMQRAVDMAANATPDSDGMNHVRDNVDRLQADLVAKGQTPETARLMAATRIFAPARGVYGSIEGMVRKGRGSTKPDALADLYTQRMGHAYGRGESWGAASSDIFKDVMKGTDAAVFSRTGRLYGVMDADEPFGFFGGFSLAVRSVSGKAPKLYIANMRAAPGKNATMQTAQRFLLAEAHARYLNPAWIQAMQKEGGSGAKEMRDFVANLYGWQVTAPESVAGNLWKSAVDVYVRDRYLLKIGDWMSKADPEAVKAFAGTALKAAEGGFWTPSEPERAALQTAAYSGRLGASEPSGGSDRSPFGVPGVVPVSLGSGGGPAPGPLGTAGVSTGFSAGSVPTSSGGSRSALDPPRGPSGLRGRSPRLPSVPKQPSLPFVTGRRMEEIRRGTAQKPDAVPVMPLTAVAAVIFLVGFVRGIRPGVRRDRAQDDSQLA